MLNNAKHRNAIYLKFEGRLFFFSLSMLGLQSKVSINSTIKENLLLYYRKFSAFVVAVVIEHVLTTESDSQRKTACNRNRELWNTIIQNRLLNVTHSISDIHLPGLTGIMTILYPFIQGSL